MLYNSYIGISKNKYNRKQTLLFVRIYLLTIKLAFLSSHINFYLFPDLLPLESTSNGKTKVELQLLSSLFMWSYDVTMVLRTLVIFHFNCTTLT